MKSEPSNDFFSIPMTLNLGGRLLDLKEPKVMGILNVTPDSFFDGGRYTSAIEILQHTEKMIAEGATLIDVGAYSSRPGAADVPEAEEIRRSSDAIKLIIREFPDAVVSIDTFRSNVAAAAIGEGATLINDISSGDLDEALPAFNLKSNSHRTTDEI